MPRALVRLLPLVLLVGCHIGREGARETITWKGPIDDGARFAYRNRTGAIEVEEAAGDSAELVLTVRRRRGGSEATTVAVVRDARGLVACVQYDGDARCDAGAYDVGADTDGRSVHAVLRLPRGRALDVATRNGSIEVAVPLRDATLVTRNARVRVADVAGPLVVTTSNGSVRALGLRGPVSVTTSNASVRLALDTLAGPVDVRTSNGGVDAELPASASAILRATTSNGALALRLPGTLRTQERGRLEAVLGAGMHPITVATSNANVTFGPRAVSSADPDE